MGLEQREINRMDKSYIKSYKSKVYVTVRKLYGTD